jgi:hypothetical protein
MLDSATMQVEINDTVGGSGVYVELYYWNGSKYVLYERDIAGVDGYFSLLTYDDEVRLERLEKPRTSLKVTHQTAESSNPTTTRTHHVPISRQTHRLQQSHLVFGNAPISAVQELLGHEHIATTMQYTRTAHEHLKSAVEKISYGKADHLGTNVAHSGSIDPEVLRRLSASPNTVHIMIFIRFRMSV